MRSRPAGRFSGEMTTPTSTRPGESLLQFLVGIFSVACRPERRLDFSSMSTAPEHGSLENSCVCLGV
jgi:hypothetical protein